jgi:hypothetical protein
MVWARAGRLRLSRLADRRRAGLKVLAHGSIGASDFPSHSGNTKAARKLKRRLESAPDARAASLKAWFDKAT